MKTIASLYEITSELESDSGGIIYLGHHLRLDKNVVLKVDRYSSKESAAASQKREAEMLKNLNHTNIPQIYDFIFEDGIAYTVMDYIEGVSLDKLLKRGERFTSQQIVKWAKQVLEALVYLHSRPPYGILHSDIKPANLMLTPQGDVRLIDFNIALALGEDGAVSVGRSQGYASPEHYGIEYSSNSTYTGSRQTSFSKATTGSKHISYSKATTGSRQISISKATTGSRPQVHAAITNVSDTETDVSGDKMKTVVLDARSDIYGLGATLYHLVTGRKPAKHTTDVIPLIAEDCPPGLCAIINKAMSPDRSLRFQSAEDMLSAFESIHTNDPRAKRHRLLRVVIAVFLAVILSVGALAVFVGIDLDNWHNRVVALAKESEQAHSEGDKSGAVKLALDAVETQCVLYTPPVPAIAQKALADSLEVYKLSEGFKLHHTLSLPSAPLMAQLSPDGKTAAVVYAYETAVVNLETGKIVKKSPWCNQRLPKRAF